MLRKQAGEVKGYADLSEDDQRLFREFLSNFYRGSTWIPEKVARKKDRSNGSYLRVDFEGDYRGHRWLHVKSPTVWY